MRAMWWWIDRWRKSTAYTDLTLEEQGAYRNLLDEANLRDGAIPNDERVLGKACGDAFAWKRVRRNVLARFELQSDGWHNPTLDGVLHQCARRAAKQAAYRNRVGNAVGNGAGNASGSPDPDPDLVDQNQDLRAPRVLLEKNEPPKEPRASTEERAKIDTLRRIGTGPHHRNAGGFSQVVP